MKKEYIEKQRDLRDCGCCCLSSIIKYYNGYVPLETIRIDTHTDNNGTTAFHLIKSANKYGFDGVGMETNYNELLSSTHILPAIAQVKLKNNLLHFVVIYKISKDKITIMDPSKGYLKLSKKDFNNMWTGIIIILKPRTNITIMPKIPNIINLFSNVIKEEKKLFQKIILTSILITILSICVSFYLKFAIKTMEYNDIKILLYTMILFTSLTILKVILNHERNCYEICLNKNIDGRIIIPFLKHIFNLPLSVIKNRSKGEIVTRINELNNIKELFTNIFLAVFLDSFLVLCSIYILFMINKELFFLLCLLITLYIIISLIYNPFIYRKINDNIELETEFNSKLIENINNIESIKNLNITNNIYQNIEMSSIKYLKNTYQFNKFINSEKTFQNLIYEVGLILITSFGLFLIMKNKFTLLNLITFNSLLAYFIEPIKNIADIIPKYNFIKASFQKISEFNVIKEEVNQKDSNYLNGDIYIRNISYSYNGLDNIINNFSVDILENEHVFISGKSGTGKSTLCKLIMKYDENYKGDILIGGVNIKDYNINTIRNNISYVSQNELLFTGTIKDNITLGENIETEKLNNIIKICKIDEILQNKPLRLETMLLDSAQNLSGGEKQRIILARSLLQDKKIIILDEALNEIEEDKEIEIIKNLNTLFQDRTIIYISHRNHSHLFQKNIYLRSNNYELL